MSLFGAYRIQRHKLNEMNNEQLAVALKNCTLAGDYESQVKAMKRILDEHRPERPKKEVEYVYTSNEPKDKSIGGFSDW